jgi:hypothetical protein
MSEALLLTKHFVSVDVEKAKPRKLCESTASPVIESGTQVSTITTYLCTGRHSING